MMIKALLVLIMFALSGCAAPLVLTGLSVGSIATQETTGKSITDHVVSTVATQDCKMSRMLRDESVCQEETQPVKLKITTTGVTPSSVEEIQAKYK